MLGSCEEGCSKKKKIIKTKTQDFSFNEPLLWCPKKKKNADVCGEWSWDSLNFLAGRVCVTLQLPVTFFSDLTRMQTEGTARVSLLLLHIYCTSLPTLAALSDLVWTQTKDINQTTRRWGISLEFRLELVNLWRGRIPSVKLKRGLYWCSLCYSLYS